MLTARWAASCSAAKARSDSASSSGVSAYATSTVPAGRSPAAATASMATRTACPVPCCSSWTASSASGTSAWMCGPTWSRWWPTTATIRRGCTCLDRRQHVADHAPPRHRVQHLHGLGLHPGAAAGGQDDDGQLLVISSGFAHAPRVGVEPTSLVLIQSQAGPAGRPTGESLQDRPARRGSPARQTNRGKTCKDRPARRGSILPGRPPGKDVQGWPARRGSILARQTNPGSGQG